MTTGLRIGWIRHGQTEWNRIGRIQGVTDIPLNAEGVRQAERLAARLADERDVWNGVVASPLARARETGRIVAERLGIPLLTDDRLIERSFGQAEGTSEEQRLARWGADWRQRIPDQETSEQVRARGLSFIEDFGRAHAGESWFVVTHGSFLAQILYLLKPDLQDSYIGNVSLTIMERVSSGWTVSLHNCMRHLEDA